MSGAEAAGGPGMGAGPQGMQIGAKKGANVPGVTDDTMMGGSGKDILLTAGKAIFGLLTGGPIGAAASLGTSAIGAMIGDRGPATSFGRGAGPQGMAIGANKGQNVPGVTDLGGPGDGDGPGDETIKKLGETSKPNTTAATSPSGLTEQERRKRAQGRGSKSSTGVASTLLGGY